MRISVNRFESVIKDLMLGEDGVYSEKNISIGEDQQQEIILRESVSEDAHDDYLMYISKHHSISVMDSEVVRFITKTPENSLIIDVGGCWGWHWRNIENYPGRYVVIVDFIRSNLLHAKNVLGDLIGNKVILVQADATNLPFSENLFDGFWTVQTFQHIPDFNKACSEAYRVLKKDSLFVNYSLHYTPFIKLIYSVFGKYYHKSGKLDGCFILNKASNEQYNQLAEIFDNKVDNYYTEILFHPDLKITFSGRYDSLVGKIDSSLIRNNTIFRRLFARQRSFEVIK